MDSSNKNVNITKRRIIGLISLIVFSLAFIFACLKPVLPVGDWLVGTFGWLVYPMSLVFAFISLAIFLGFSYSKSTKPVRLFVIALFAILLTIHSMQTFKELDAVVKMYHLKNYLNVSYSKVTVVGSFGSILCGLISMLLGGMGTIVAFVIIATIFIGLLFDYELYGKYHETHIKKLKTRKLRENVLNSDKNVNGGVPDYSFENQIQNGSENEVVVDAKTYEQGLKNEDLGGSVSYNPDDVVAEIDDANYESKTGYDYGQNPYQDDTQTLNTFDNNIIYQQGNVPDIYSKDDMDKYRREFMEATYGGYRPPQNDNSVSQNEIGGFGFNPKGTDFDSLPSIEDDENLKSFELGRTQEPEDVLIDTDLTNILKENDVESEVQNDVFESPYNSPFKNNGFDYQTPTGVFSPNNNLKGNDDSDDNLEGRYGLDFIKEADKIQKPYNNAIENHNIGGFGNPQTGLQTGQIGTGFGTQTGYGTGFGNGAQIGNGTGFGGSQSPYNSGVSQQPTIQNKNIKSTQVVIPGVRYNAPSLSLLRTPVPDKGDYSAEQNRKSMILENSLEAFKIPAKVKNIVRGPKITRYELALPLGTSVRKIPMYENDIAAALAAKTITIKAPIPGSNYVGIELENDTFSNVYERELLESEAFQNCKDPLPIAIGKDISGEIVVKSLVEMVHLLIAGSTGSGKSVFIHNIVLSLIYKYSPDDLRLIMIDPKKVEFPRYNGLPHLLTPEVVAGSQKAISALKWCVKEMQRRYDLMAKAGFNNIKPYNKSDLVKTGQFEKMPYIVIIVDELAEIMLANKKEAEASIQSLTQLARACGMHMVLATQRPSVDIITGVIKNNIPSRIAFSLQSGIDSKTILNTVGAEKLLGKGDMIFYPTGTAVLSRLQASYATDDEIDAVIAYTIKNNPASYDMAVETAISEEPAESDASGFKGGEGVPQARDTLDVFFKDALKLVMQNGGASTSYLQRRLAIGYSRAAKIIDQMTDKGYIAQANGSKQRKIIITPEEFKEQFGEDFDS